ncbi:iron ascorbate-dependent oxidoreductase [Salvia divinorum]|uniref:Iron ascorbate-dependent oxidoreductase n=1 Tax=Salvia divinorum TaxID=28513 RepID=A0ABD1FRL6_SALDI
MEKLSNVAGLSSNDQELPAEFIRPEAEVPVVDFGDPESLVRAVYEASSKWGLFQIVNHSISKEVIEHLQRVGRQFFELPNEEKMAYAKDPESKNIDGYGSRHRNGWVDHLFNKIWPPNVVEYRFWPKNPSDYRYFCLILILAWNL